MSEEERALASKRERWRGAYQRQLEKIAQLRHQIDVLDQEIPALWNRFYATDDPYQRDGVIKPRLDRALERRSELETELAEAEAELGRIKDQARRDGAEPGWFRGLSIGATPVPPTPKPGYPGADVHSTVDDLSPDDG